MQFSPTVPIIAYLFQGSQFKSKITSHRQQTIGNRPTTVRNFLKTCHRTAYQVSVWRIFIQRLRFRMGIQLATKISPITFKSGSPGTCQIQGRVVCKTMKFLVRHYCFFNERLLPRLGNFTESVNIFSRLQYFKVIR